MDKFAKCFRKFRKFFFNFLQIFAARFPSMLNVIAAAAAAKGIVPFMLALF